MKSLILVIFCILAISQIQAQLDSRLIGTAPAADVGKNTVAFINSENKIICSGVIISFKSALTTATCAKKISILTRYQTGAAADRIYKNAKRIDEIKIHPGFNPTTLVNDIAIVKFPDFIDLDVSPITIAKNADKMTDKEYTVRGFGLAPSNGGNQVDNNQPADGKLYESIVRIEDRIVFCNKYLETPIPPNKVCSSINRACQGDQGGPLVETGTVETLHAIVSVPNYLVQFCGETTHTKEPVVSYIQVAPYYTWIKNNAGSPIV